MVVPDAEQYLHTYCIDGWQELERLRLLGPGHSDPYNGLVYKTKMELVNMIFRQGTEHKFVYDYETLRRALEGCGFVQVTRISWGLRSETSLL